MRSYFERDMMMKSKKKVLDVFNGSHETYTRYSGVDDEKQKKKQS